MATILCSDIVPKCLTRNVVIVPPKERKCYKCQRVREMKEFAPSPLPDMCNFGRTWACKACLTQDSFDYDLTL